MKGLIAIKPVLETLQSMHIVKFFVIILLLDYVKELNIISYDRKATR